MNEFVTNIKAKNNEASYVDDLFLNYFIQSLTETNNFEDSLLCLSEVETPKEFIEHIRNEYAKFKTSQSLNNNDDKLNRLKLEEDIKNTLAKNEKELLLLSPQPAVAVALSKEIEEIKKLTMQRASNIEKQEEEDLLQELREKQEAIMQTNAEALERKRKDAILQKEAEEKRKKNESKLAREKDLKEKEEQKQNRQNKAAKGERKR